MQAHVDVERWTRLNSLVHRWDSRAKLLAILCAIVFIGCTPSTGLRRLAAYAVLLIAALLVSRLPIRDVLIRAAVVLPFSAAFSLISLLAGDIPRALALPIKSYLSCLAALLIVGTTPLPSILRALDFFRAPRYILFVIQFVYRYLFVLFEEARAMRLAAKCRGGEITRNRPLFQAAAGSLAVLFSRSFDRAEGIHFAMLSRGFTGEIRILGQGVARRADVVALIAAVTLLTTVWMVV